MKKIFSLLALIALAVMFGGCAKKADYMEKIKASGKLVVYCNPEFAPYEYVGKDNAIIGCEMDIVRRIAEKLGVEAEIVSSEFDAVLGSVVEGKADMGASGFTITEERKQRVDFSIPFVKSVQYLIVKEGSGIQHAEDLAGKKIGGQNGTTGFMMCEDAVNKGMLKGLDTKCLSFNTAPDAVVAMQAGRLDAVVIDELVAIGLTKNAPGYICFPLETKAGKPLADIEEFGIIIAKGKPELLKIINETINEMLKDGSFEKSVLFHNMNCLQK